jgi:hypothetical protein
MVEKKPKKTVKKKTPKKNKGGRPTKYKKAYNEQVIKLCRLGAKDKELADFFNICEKTLNNWKNNKEFLQSLKEGKELADATVADSLFKRATGYEHEDLHFSSHEGEVTATEYIKHYPPDPTSMIFWLKNRRPDLFRDKHDVTLDAAIKGEIKVNIVTGGKKNENNENTGDKSST